MRFPNADVNSTCKMHHALQLNLELLDDPRAEGVEEQWDGHKPEGDEGERRISPAHRESGVHVEGAEREEGAGQGSQDGQSGRD